MGHTASKNPKINKNHNKQKMFRIGISTGRNDLNLEGHVQMGYSSKTVKKYNPVEKPQEDNIQNVDE
jgi:phage protein D